ncbi:MAG: hypothetical protein K2O67_03430, partial [Clostridia bacterium]|nr:hypothetical protein [Clostridia bacterium]
IKVKSVKEKGMSEEKRNKIIAAVTVNAVLLVVIIIAVIIAQIVHISVLNNRKRELTNQYNQLVEQLKTTEDTLERMKLDEEYYWLIVQMRQIDPDFTPVYPTYEP